MRLMYKEDYNKLLRTDIAYILHGADVLKRLGIIKPEEHFYLSVASSREFLTDILYRGPLILSNYRIGSNKYERDAYGNPFCKVDNGIYIATCQSYNEPGESLYSLRDVTTTLITGANRYIIVYYRMFLDDFVKYMTDTEFMGAELVELTP